MIFKPGITSGHPQSVNYWRRVRYHCQYRRYYPEKYQFSERCAHNHRSAAIVIYALLSVSFDIMLIKAGEKFIWISRDKVISDE